MGGSLVYLKKPFYLGGTFFNPEHFEWIYDNVEKAIRWAKEWEEALITLPNIETYIGGERIKTVKEFKAIFDEATVVA